MKRLVVQNAKYLDVYSGEYKENQTIVMEDRKFTSIGDSYDKQEGDQVIDASGKFVLPGMIDCHVHLEFSGEIDMYRPQMTTPTGMYDYIALQNAQRQLMSGFTTVRDVGIFNNSYPAIKNTLNELMFAGSRVFGAHRILSQNGRQENEMPDYIHYGEGMETESGPIGMREAVRKRITKGADWIKIEATGGVLHGKHSVLNQSFFADDELDAIVSEAHRMNKYVCAHAHGDDGIYRGTKAGIDTIEHGSFISEESAKLMSEKGNYLIATKIALTSLKEPDVFKEQTVEVQNRINEASELSTQCHKRAYDMGVKFALGTDAGTPQNQHGKSAIEISLLHEKLGISTLKALQMATVEASKAIKLEDKIGSIAEGKFADLVIVDQDPLLDVKVLQNYNNLSHVIRDGIVMAERGKITYTLSM